MLLLTISLALAKEETEETPPAAEEATEEAAEGPSEEAPPEPKEAPIEQPEPAEGGSAKALPEPEGASDEDPGPEPVVEEAFEEPPPAKEKKVRSVGLAESPYGFGFGVILGDPTGLSGAWRPDETKMVDIALAWSIPNNSFELHGDYQHTVIEIRDPNADQIAFPVSVGGGLKFSSQTSRGNSTPIFGVRVPVMLAVVPDTVPIDAFLEVAPVLELYPGTRLTADAGLGARVWFN